MKEDWKERLVDEHNELKERLVKLVNFMASEEFFKLSENYKTVLNNQKVGMEIYLQALNLRLYEDLDDYTKHVPNMGALSLVASMFNSPWESFNKPTISECNN